MEEFFHETYKNNKQEKHQKQLKQAGMQRMRQLMPVSMQNILYSSKSSLRKLMIKQ
jgi:hypothetical protein